MSVMRYLSFELPAIQEVEAFILPNISFDGDSVFLGGLSFSRLSFVDWQILEKTQFARDLVDTIRYDPPFFCVFCSNDTDTDAAVIAYRSKARKSAVKLFITALRLKYPGNIETPLDYIIYRRGLGENARDPGRLGRNAYNRRPDNACKIAPADYPAIENMYYSLKMFQYCRENRAIWFSLHLFEQSYDPALIGAFPRMLFLLSSLETLLGDHAGDIALLSWDDDDTIRFCKDYGRIRNAIAHGRRGGQTEQVELLRKVLRVLLGEAIAHELEFPGSGKGGERALIERLNASAGRRERIESVRVEYPRML